MFINLYAHGAELSERELRQFVALFLAADERGMMRVHEFLVAQQSRQIEQRHAARARVLLNFFQSRKEAEELAASISEFAPAPILLQGDASQARDWERVKHDVGAIDVLINNASPVIPAAKFREQTTPDFISFVNRSLELFLVPCAQLLSHMSAEAIVVQVSSVFVTQPGPGFSHYIAAKSAAEAVMRSLAQEHKALRFLIFRAPRMLTDQTNTAVPPENLASPIEVAKTLLQRLDKFEPHVNFQLFSY